MKLLRLAAYIAVGLLAGTEVLLPAESTISLSPASASLKGPAGHTYTQPFTIANFTPHAYTFNIRVDDVVIEGGKRKYVPAGQTPGSVAATVSHAQSVVTLEPGQKVAVPVVFVMPSETSVRAVAVFFSGEERNPEAGKPRTRLSLGAVVDFTCSEGIHAELKPLEITPPTETTNALFVQPIANRGAEPFFARGVVALLTVAGKLAGKSEFEKKRLLPGEATSLRAEFPGTLTSGTYRALMTVEYAGRTATQTFEFRVP